MQDFVHLHVHTQYSLLDGQASVARLVDKAMKNGMKGIAVTDHGNMFGIKEFTNYVNKKNSGPKGEIKDLKKRIAGIEAGTVECEDKEAEVAACKAKIVEAEFAESISISSTTAIPSPRLMVSNSRKFSSYINPIKNIFSHKKALSFQTI
jgi:DNA polymerase III alpha subunit